MSAALLNSLLDEDGLFDLDFDPSKPSLQTSANAGHPFSVCWSREVRSILAGLDSRYLKDAAGPWVLESPFDVDQIKLCAIIPDSVGEKGFATAGNYRDGLSTSAASSSEHLSASLGLTIGYPFANASVTGKYDRDVAENKDGIKASRNSSCRAGRVVLDSTPVLSGEAIATLQSAGGEDKFRARYGDFYIWGFALGADAGACMSTSTTSMESQETFEVTVKVKALFYEESFSHKETERASIHSSSISFSGYSTLDGNSQPYTLTLASGSAASQRGQRIFTERAASYMKKVASLQEQVWKRLQEHGISDGKKLPLSECSRLCSSGLVAELLLAPFARLNQYVESIGLRRV